MKFCSYRSGSTQSYGVLEQSEVLDLKQALGVNAPQTLDQMIETLATGQLTLDAIRRALSGGKVTRIPVAGLQWLPPLGRPSKIMGVAANNRGLAQMAWRPFENPAFFLKPPSSLTGHNQPVIIKREYGLTHPEPELAVIIGRRGKDIPEAQALDYVFGYSIINDITSADLKQGDSVELIAPAAVTAAQGKITWRQMLQAGHENHFYLTYHLRSKGCDTFAPMGPCIVTRDEIADPNRIKIDGYWQEVHLCEDSTSNLIFPVQRVIAYASKYFTLEVGDVIHCGTAIKVASPQKFPTLQSCDLSKIGGSVGVKIEGIGYLSNPVQLS